MQCKVRIKVQYQMATEDVNVIAWVRMGQLWCKSHIAVLEK